MIPSTDWPSRTPPSSADGVPAPGPWLQAARVDPLGRLWVIAWVADRRWRLGIDVRRVTGGAEQGWEMRSVDPAQFQDTVIEVFDLARKRLVVAGRFNQSCRGFTPTGDLMCDELNEDGTYRIEIRPIRVSGPGRH